MYPNSNETVEQKTPERPHPPVGAVLAGRYHLDRLIASGGMGIVYAATDTFLRQKVAIKVLTLRAWEVRSERLAEALANLRSEAVASIKLSHPNIVRTYNYERDGDWEFLVMEYVHGEDLRRHRKHFEGDRLPPGRVRTLGLELSDALEHAHHLGILHLDIKPANVLILPDGHFKLCDFGLSALTALLREPREGRLTVGTPAYMSPEMLRQDQVDHRADLYSLSATMYELTTGQPPFGYGYNEATRGHMQTTPTFPSDMPPALTDVLRRGLEKDPKIRFQSAGAFHRALELANVESAGAPSPIPVAKTQRTRTATPMSLASGGGELATFWYEQSTNQWSVPSLPELDSPRTLVVAFGDPTIVDDPVPIAELAAAYPRSRIVACSSSGEVIGREIRDGTLSVSVFRFEHTELRSASVTVDDQAHSFDAGKKLGRELSGADLRAVFVLSDGLKVNGSELVRGFNAVLPADVVVTGGLAGDGTRFERTWVAHGGDVASGMIAAVGLYGDHLLIGHGSRGGFQAFGPQRQVTRSQGNVVQEIDGRPALALYKQYLGDKAEGLPATGMNFPLALRERAGDEKYLIRTLLAVDEANQSLTFAGDVPVGWSVQLMRANYDKLVDGAGEAGQSARKLVSKTKHSHGPTLAIAVSCVGRRVVLGERTEEELEALLEALPSDTKATGFYSYGELSPFSTGTCDLHNQTMTLTTFSETPTPLAKGEDRGDVPTAAQTTAVGLKNNKKLRLPPVQDGRAPTGPRPVVPATTADGNRVESFYYDRKRKKWSIPELPAVDSPQTLVIAFGDPALVDDPAPLQELAKMYPRSQVIACSSSGEVIGREIRDGTLSVAAIAFQRTRLRSASVTIDDQAHSYEAGQKLGRELAGEDLRAVFVVSDGLKVNGSELVRGFNAVLPNQVVVTGGLAGDGTRFERTWVAHGSEMASGMIAAVAFYGDHVLIGHGSRGGFVVFGPERQVTRSQGNVVHEIDGRPALALYKQYLGDKAKGLPATGMFFPLALRERAGDEKFLIRTLLAVDEADQSLVFAGDVPTGWSVQLMRADHDRLVEGATGAGHSAEKVLPDVKRGATLAVAVSCVGRRVVLGDRTEEELEALLDTLPEDTHATGFYSYGELSPFSTGSCDLHNQTMTLTTFSESAEPVYKRNDRSASRPNAAGAPKRITDAGPSVVDLEQPTSVFRSEDVAQLLHRYRVTSFHYDLTAQSWSLPQFPPLDSECTLVLLFGAPRLRDNPEPLQQLARFYKQSHIIGCSGSGEIIGTDLRDDSLSVAVVRFEKTSLATVTATVGDKAESYMAGRTLASKLNRPDLRSVFVLSDGLCVNGSELIRGFNSVLDPTVVVTGGLAGDGTRFESTWVAQGAKIESGLVAAVGLYGDHLIVGHGCRAGFEVFGPQRRVTVSDGNVVYEIDGKPALALYKQYLGAKAQGLPATGMHFPLALRERPNDEKYLIRTLLAVDETQQSLTFAGDVPNGWSVQLMRANFDRLVEGASNAGQSARWQAPKGREGALLAVAVSCVGRRVVLGERTDEEIEALVAALPKGTVTTGFYSYGELSPFSSGTCDLHNQTMTLTTFSESPEPVEYGRRRSTSPRIATRPPSQPAAMAPPPVPPPNLRPPASASPTSARGPQASRQTRRGGAVPPPLPTKTGAGNGLSSAPPVGQLFNHELFGQMAPSVHDTTHDVEMPALPRKPPSLADTVVRPPPLELVDAPPRPQPTISAPAKPSPMPTDLQQVLVRPHPMPVSGRGIASSRPSSRALLTAAHPAVQIRASSIATAISSLPNRGLDVQQNRVGDITIVRLSGRLTESFKGAELGRRLSGTVVFDLAGVERVTSFGVREWLQMLEAASANVDQLYFVACSEPFVNQLSMIRSLAGNGQVVSFYAPYSCTECNECFSVQLDCERDCGSLRYDNAADIECPSCAGRGAFDDDPATYFAFAKRHLDLPVPEAVRAVIQAVPAEVGEPPMAGFEKWVEGELTTLIVRGPIDQGLRWNRALDGVEGDVAIDFTAATDVTVEGAERFEREIQRLAAAARRVSLHACPRFIAERLAFSANTFTRIVSVCIETQCGACNVPRRVVVELEREAPSIRSGTLPYIPCPRCDAALPLVQHQRLFELLVREQSMQPVLTKSGPAQPRIGDEFVDEPIALPTKPWKKLLPYAAVAAVTLGLAALAYKIGQSSSPSEFTNPSAAGVLAGPDAILPPWTERKFVTEGGFVRVVGFGRAANERDAQAAARIDAVERLVTELGESLGSSRYAGLLRSRSGERSASAKEAVVKQFAAAHGDVASPERTEAFMVQNGDAVEFFGQYSLPLAAYEGLKKAYEVESDYAGLTVVNLFPGLSSAVPDNAGLVIARVAPGSLAARGGLREGDVIVAIDGKPVPNVAAFKAIKGDLFYQRGEPHIVSITVDLDGTRRELWMRRPRE